MDIDLVYTWVNPRDPRWNAKRQRYACSEAREDELYANGDARYSDHGELAYSLQSLERYVPFVRHIYIAHAGAPPNWLESRPNWLRSRDKISLIEQDDLLPSDVAPTFQSDVIECFLYNIPGLSEHYLYSNDDFFFSKNHVEADFFTKNGECLIGVSDRFAAMDVDGPFAACEINSVQALQKRLRLPAHIL